MTYTVPPLNPPIAIENVVNVVDVANVDVARIVNIPRVATEFSASNAPISPPEFSGVYAGNATASPPEFSRVWEFSTKATALGEPLRGSEVGDAPSSSIMASPVTPAQNIAPNLPQNITHNIVPNIAPNINQNPPLIVNSNAAQNIPQNIPQNITQDIPRTSQRPPLVPPPEPRPSLVIPDPDSSGNPNNPNNPAPSPAPIVTPPPNPATIPVVELNADRQEFSIPRQVVTAEGNVLLRYQQAVLNADRAQVNIPNRFVSANGNVVLRRGFQVLRGDRFQYFFVQDQGTVFNSSGEIFLPTTTGDFLIDNNPVVGLPRLPSTEVLDRQPLQNIIGRGGYSFIIGGGTNFSSLPTPQAGGMVNRLRFQAEELTFDSTGWSGRNVRITNDPFSPPELELRADTARVQQTQTAVTEITATRARLVFDQSTEIPLLLDRLVLDRRDRGFSIFDVGFDNGDRGGLYIQRSFRVIDRPGFVFTVTPQYFVQRATIGGAGLLSPSAFGVVANLESALSPTTLATGNLVLTSFTTSEIENRLRASLRIRQTLGEVNPHFLNLEYTYRDRLFNGSLGFQTVHSSIGAVLVSPLIALGDTGITLSYQGGIQNINSETDRFQLLSPVRANNRINLTRYQASATLGRSFRIWQGEALPATREEGLRYSPSPVRPFLQINATLNGLYSGYSNGDSQEALTGRIELQGQLGNFSRLYGDYTAFNIGYSQTIKQGSSPFLFDRLVDTRVLSAGIVQQVYGPFLIGFQTAINLDSGAQISTDYILEYRRRTHSITIRYNPIVQVGSINLRISDFNWNGNAGSFDDNLGIRPVVQGVTRD
jgi:lipopolysaccharide export system protein LptA